MMFPERLPPRYTVLRELGAGGMGRVFLVRDRHIERDVALKVLHRRPGGAEDIQRLRDEFALLAKLEHPGIARAYDFGFAGKLPYFTSQFIRGTTLPVATPGSDRAMATAPLPPDFFRRARWLVEALAFLHRSGIVHLDIKPSNILVGADDHPVIIDFGLFRRGVPGRVGGRLRGSLPYMAPEYFRGETIGPWTDIYALGVTLYQAATGTLPRPGAALDGGESGEGRAWLPAPRPPTDLEPSLPEDFAHIVLKCLALDPAERFQSAGDLLETLHRLRTGPVPAGGSGVATAATTGRSPELAEIDAFVRALTAGGSAEEPTALLITGAPGMGQSRLLGELRVRAQTCGFPCYLETGYPGRLPTPGALLRPLASHLRKEARGRWEALLEKLRRPRVRYRSEVTLDEMRLRWRGEITIATAALREPLILAVDGLQFFDEVSVLLLIDLARVMRERRGHGPALGLAVGCREEGALQHLLRDLCEVLLQPGAARVLTLKPLGPIECRELYHAAGGDEQGVAGGLGLLQDSGGSPGKIVAMAREPRRGAVEAAPETEREETGASLPERGSTGRQLFVFLASLRRPAAADELARISGLTPRVVEGLLDRLQESRLVAEDRPGSGAAGWVLAPGTSPLLERCSRAERRRAHRRLAEALEAAAGESDEMALLEAAEHYESAGNRGHFIRLGLRAVEYLRDTLQNRTALDLLVRIRDALPRTRRRDFLRVILAITEIQARVGQIESGMEILRRQLREPRNLPDPVRVQMLLRLATLHSRNGDFQMADSLFRRGLREAEAGRACLKREERLLFLNEHAALKVFLGDFDGALEFCEAGLALARRGPRSRGVQEIVLNLHATRANVALRRYRFQEAERDFLRALERAESIGSTVNEAVILNNLGIVYVHCDRYPDAVRVLRKAERTCLELDEGPSLTFIYGNLALLYAKTGDFASMEEALEKASALTGPGATGPADSRPGRRQQFFLEHHRGVSLLYRGRFAEARPHLKEAVRLGRAVGDRQVTVFDEVYHAECLVFEGLYGEALEQLRRLAAEDVPVVPRRMALARWTFLEGLTGNLSALEQLHERYGETGPDRERPVPFLEAWDALFIGWALFLSGRRERAAEALAVAEDFFREHGLRPGGSLAAWVRAEGRFLAGQSGAALEVLAEAPETGSDLTRVLWPLLEARCLLEMKPPGVHRAADRLAEAGTALVGNSLPEWSVRLDVLRRALLGAEDPTAGVKGRRKELASRLEDPSRYLESDSWKRWCAVEVPGPAGAEPGHPGSPGEPLSATGTAPLPPRGHASMRRGLVLHSASMRRLARQLDQIRKSDLPVLIHGETGSGKELVARAIHMESARAKAPFIVVDCATVPEALLELELFGARRGAFTGLEEDRPGLLQAACGGTLLFDEIGGVSPEIQGKLRRLLDAGEFRPLGSDEVTRVDVRFLFSTARDLDREVRAGVFREDLLHRIRVLSVEVPPLEERREDIPTLVRLFLEGGGTGTPTPELEPGFLEGLAARRWPGNVRELRNLLERLRLEHPGRIPREAAGGEGDEEGPTRSTAAVFSADLRERESLETLKARLERDYILFHLRRLDGDTRELSRFLGIGRKQLYRRCRALGLSLRRLQGNRD